MRPPVDPTQTFVDFDCLFPINQCYITLIVQVRCFATYSVCPTLAVWCVKKGASDGVHASSTMLPVSNLVYGMAEF
jgi:hypothetical protein